MFRNPNPLEIIVIVVVALMAFGVRRKIFPDRPMKPVGSVVMEAALFAASLVLLFAGVVYASGLLLL